jgi:hypothetical protein
MSRDLRRSSTSEGGGGGMAIELYVMLPEEEEDGEGAGEEVRDHSEVTLGSVDDLGEGTR